MAMREFDIYKYPVSPDYLANLRDLYFMPTYTSPRNYQYTSRYQYTRRIIEDNNRKEVIHESYDLKPIPEDDYEDRYLKVDNTTVNRLDIISYQMYGYPIYWWVIAVANNIIDVFDVPYGKVLRIPPLASLYKKGSVLDNE